MRPPSEAQSDPTAKTPVSRAGRRLGRVWSQLKEARTKGAGRQRGAEPPEGPPAEPLARLLNEAPAIWGSRRAAGRDDERLDSSEAANAHAARQGLETRLETRRAASFRPADLPAIVLTSAGAGRLLLARRGDVFEARGAEGDYPISLEALAREESGSVFLIREKAADEPDEEEAGDPAKGVMRHMWTRQRGLLIQLLLAAAFSNMMLLALPIYTGLVYDRVIPHSAFDTLWAISIGMTLALLGDLVMRGVRLKLQDALSARASAVIQARVTRRLMEVRMSDAPRSAGAVTMRLRELDNLTQIAPMFMTGVLIDAPFLALVFALIYIDGGPVLFAPMLGLAALWAIHQLTHRAAKSEQAKVTRLANLQTNKMIEAIDNLEAVKLARVEGRMIGRFERIFDEYSHASHVVKLWNGVGAYANLSVGQFMVVLVMVIGVYQVSAGAMTMGGLSSCSLLAGRIINPMGQLIVVLHKMMQSRATLKALTGGGTGRSEAAGDVSGALGAPSRGALRLQGVGFNYPGQTSPQLNDVSFSIQPGERVAIIGRSGSGKTTLLRLLTRLLEPDRGAVLIDEIDARQYAPADIRRSFGFMSQSPGLFDDTLAANLALGGGALDAAIIEEVAKLTGVADFASRHPNGYSMPVGPRGERLSGGERQSVALARLLLADPLAVILDEPTAAMDTMLEARFVRDFRAYLGPRTLIVATHRAPILELVDRLIWLEGGKVIADGPKADVLRRMSGAAA